MAVIRRTNSSREQQFPKQVFKVFYESQNDSTLYTSIWRCALKCLVNIYFHTPILYTNRTREDNSYYYILRMPLIIKAADAMGVYFHPRLTTSRVLSPNWADDSKNKIIQKIIIHR